MAVMIEELRKPRLTLWMITLLLHPYFKGLDQTIEVPVEEARLVQKIHLS